MIASVVVRSRKSRSGTIGSGAAPLTKLLLDGHGSRIGELTKQERDIIMAWMDTNSNYYGTWNWTEYATCEAILSAGSALAAEMMPAPVL